MSGPEPTTLDTRLMKALGHPLRHRILERLNDDTASPSRLAADLDEPLANVSYHTKILLDAGAIELVETRPVRGALEHLYRATARPYFDDAIWATLPVSIQNQIIDATVKKAWEHLVTAAQQGGLDHPQVHVSWTALDLDAEGFANVVEILGSTLDRVLEEQAAAVGRLSLLPEAGRDTERTELTVLHYHRPRAT
jgi:DNA-binding transcriptional ArsR family regulator